jgi:glycosyltransferase involved in cell wall biosynthesis
MPKVTVLMPTYNVAPYVKEAVESVLRQTYSGFDLLVIDDCSTDGTLDVVRSINDSRIRIVQNEYNLGLADNLNRGLGMIHTEYVARMDGDDIAEPDWLEKEVSVLDNNPEIGVCGGCAQRFGTSDSLVILPESHEECKVNMLFSCSTLVPVYRHELYSKYGLRYSHEAFPAEDYRFWADCIKVTRFHNVQKVLFHYRMHETQICTSLKDAQIGKTNEVRRVMLEWLDAEMNEEDKQYFLTSFIAGEIHDRETLTEQKQFAEKLLRLNQKQKHFDSQALCRGLTNHIQLSVYSTVINDYFGSGYSLKSYCKYLKSGLAFNTKPKFESKLFFKSLLHRP